MCTFTMFYSQEVLKTMFKKRFSKPTVAKAILIASIFLYLIILPNWTDGVKVEIPRFPHNIEKQTFRELAVFYSPDDISASTSLSDLGFPDKALFLLHREHPQLKITMQTVPANRYIESQYRDITTIKEPLQGVCCRTLWKMILSDELLDSWMEIGNHGYSHSPPEDSNLDHHEFSATQSGCNVDHSLANTLNYCSHRFKLARAAYAQIGLDNDKIIVMRFPGFAYTDAALRALLDNGFIAFFGGGDCKQDEWIKLSDGREILNIPSTSLYRFYEGDADNFTIPECVKTGRFINFFDHWWDMFKTDANGTNRNYQIASGSLTYIEHQYGDQVWWPFGSELALWFYFKRNAITNWETTNSTITINATVPKWNPNWKEISISYSVTLPKALKLYKIEYSLDNTNWQELNPKMYWQNNTDLYFNVPFKGFTKIKLTFSQWLNLIFP